MYLSPCLTPHACRCPAQYATKEWLQRLLNVRLPELPLAALLKNGILLRHVANTMRALCSRAGYSPTRSPGRARAAERLPPLTVDVIAGDGHGAGHNYSTYANIDEFMLVTRELGMSDIQRLTPSDVAFGRHPRAACTCLQVRNGRCRALDSMPPSLYRRLWCPVIQDAPRRPMTLSPPPSRANAPLGTCSLAGVFSGPRCAGTAGWGRWRSSVSIGRSLAAKHLQPPAVPYEASASPDCSPVGRPRPRARAACECLAGGWGGGGSPQAAARSRILRAGHGF